MQQHNLKEFINNSPVNNYLESCWNGEYYLNFPLNSVAENVCDVTGTNAHALFFLTYSELMHLPCAISGRAAKLALWLAKQIRDNGYCNSNDTGGVTDHPAACSTAADAIATVAFYAKELGVNAGDKALLVDAVTRMISNHHRLRYPEGVQGRSQQLRFELRVYYWMSLLSDDRVWKERFELGLKNGLNRYKNPAAIDGAFIVPSIYPDWTWNYVGGTSGRQSTNTHTPAYYATEPNGFMFVYLHGLKNGILQHSAEFDDFCQNYIRGMFRNMSRAGHLASDLDGYGIHRAWYSPVLCEGIPLECTALAAELNMAQDASMMRYYVDRYVDFMKRSPLYAETGLHSALPYGHKINIEAQFSALATVRFYGSIARALYEFNQLEEITSVEPPMYGSYAWHQQWLKISTPNYETSFAAYTCLRNIWVVPCYGDPNLGTLIGGAPLANLMAGKELMYAAAFPIEGLWHIELMDHNGRVFRSCSTSPDDDYSMTVRKSNGDMLDDLSFKDHSTPCNLFLNKDEFIELNYRRNGHMDNYKFFVKNQYHNDEIMLNFGMTGQAGYFYDKISFVMPLPSATLEYSIDGSNFINYKAYQNEKIVALRWSIGNKWAIVDNLMFEGIGGNGKFTVKFIDLPTAKWMPGGENSFCPYPLTQVRFEIEPDTKDTRWSCASKIKFAILENLT